MNLEDRAQQHEAMMWTMANTLPRAPVYQPGDRGYGPAECTKCGDDMHEVRRRDGRVLCTPCQSAREIARR